MSPPQQGSNLPETPHPSRTVTPDAVLAHRLAQGRPGAMVQIRERYALTIYAMAYGKLLDPRQAAAAVEDVLAECRRIVTQGGLNGGTLSSLLSTTTHSLLNSRHIFATPQAEPVAPPPSIRSARLPGILRRRNLPLRRADDRTVRAESYVSSAR
jgi:hypothetical protein